MEARADFQDWKKKYFDAMRSLEQEERGFRSLESLLRRIVNRLCFAALGQTPALDVEVRRLTEAMRVKTDAHELERLFTPLSDAIAALDQRVAPPAVDMTDDVQVRLLLTRLLAEVTPDARLAERARGLEQQLAQPLRDTELATVLGVLADLVTERIRAIEEEKADVEKLLTQISARLDEMTAYLAGEDEDRKLSLENTQQLNDRLSHEMHELGESVDSTLDIVQLKLTMRARLESIGAHLQEFRDRDEDRVRQQSERSERMHARLEKLERESRELQDRLRDEQRLSLIDALTQIPNRLAYDQRVNEEYARWNDSRRPLCVAAWDIDHFKRINDAYGHRAGDKVLRIVAETLSERLRATDFLARYGGEEFVMVVPGTDDDGARELIDQMRRAVEALGFHFRSQPVAVTISCGLTMFRDGDSPEEAFERADRALYRAKEAGRNRCELA